MLGMHPVEGEYLFPRIHGHEAGFVNGLFKSLYDIQVWLDDEGESTREQGLTQDLFSKKMVNV